MTANEPMSVGDEIFRWLVSAPRIGPNDHKRITEWAMRLRQDREALRKVREEMYRALALGPFASNANSWQVWCGDWLVALDAILAEEP